jgi:lipoate-protein ligase A
LPDNASPKAKEAVKNAFERQASIRETIAKLHDLPPGPARGELISTLTKSFSDLFKQGTDTESPSGTPTPKATPSTTASPAASTTSATATPAPR